jgi:hypothetical protein
MLNNIATISNWSIILTIKSNVGYQLQLFDTRIFMSLHYLPLTVCHVQLHLADGSGKIETQVNSHYEVLCLSS